MSLGDITSGPVQYATGVNQPRPVAADVQRELAEALEPFRISPGSRVFVTVQRLIADAQKRAAAAAVTEEREAAYWKVMDAADVWMSHDKRARASVVCDFLMDLGNDIKRGRPFRRPVAYAAALDPQS